MPARNGTRAGAGVGATSGGDERPGAVLGPAASVLDLLARRRDAAEGPTTTAMVIGALATVRGVAVLSGYQLT